MTEAALKTLPHERLQREAIVQAMAALVGADGFAAASVTAVCARAKLSRQTFYQHFEGREDCFLAVLDDAYEQATKVILRAFESASSWQAGLREALASLLALFDSRPDIARLWMLESISAGPWALEHRERLLMTLGEAILDYWRSYSDAELDPAGAVTAMIGVIGRVQRQIATDDPAPLVTLLGPLMGIATDPFLDAERVAVEVRLGDKLAGKIGSGAHRPMGLLAETVTSSDIPSSIHSKRSHRLRSSLLYLANHPGASNSNVAEGIGVRSHAQISSLLKRLANMGLVQKKSSRAGYPNAWAVTQKGKCLALVLQSRGFTQI